MERGMTVNGKRIEIKFIVGQELHEIRRLFLEYAESLNIDLSFQDFATEYDSLPGKYAPPVGALLLVLVDDKAAGCAALRKIEEGICEMKRLYVRDAFRGLGIGKLLISTILGKAREQGYLFMRLDTLPSMKDAQRLYRKFGFYEIKPYVYNPIEGTIFMEKKLAD